MVRVNFEHLRYLFCWPIWPQYNSFKHNCLNYMLTVPASHLLLRSDLPLPRRKSAKVSKIGAERYGHPLFTSAAADKEDRIKWDYMYIEDSVSSEKMFIYSGNRRRLTTSQICIASQIYVDVLILHICSFFRFNPPPLHPLSGQKRSKTNWRNPEEIRLMKSNQALVFFADDWILLLQWIRQWKYSRLMDARLKQIQYWISNVLKCMPTFKNHVSQITRRSRQCREKRT